MASICVWCLDESGQTPGSSSASIDTREAGIGIRPWLVEKGHQGPYDTSTNQSGSWWVMSR